MIIAPNLKIDFSKMALVKEQADRLMSQFDAEIKNKFNINIQPYKEISSKSEFLVPIYIMWRKRIDAPTLLESGSISDKRKKIIRQALGQSERQGIVYKVENPLTELSFQIFRDFYKNFNQSQGYELLMPDSYLKKHASEDVFLITIYSAENKLLGGRLISKFEQKISTDFRAIERTKLVKEGYDTVCEKIYYDIAVKSGVSYMGRGKEFNLRGLGARHIGMLWNKLKYGYQPFILRKVPRVYVDFAFLKEKQFDLAFFISLDNKPGMIKSKDQVINLNFVCGDNPNWQEIESVKEKSLYKVNVYDRDFNLIEKPEA